MAPLSSSLLPSCPVPVQEDTGLRERCMAYGPGVLDLHLAGCPRRGSVAGPSGDSPGVLLVGTGAAWWDTPSCPSTSQLLAWLSVALARCGGFVLRSMLWGGLLIC